MPALDLALCFPALPGCLQSIIPRTAKQYRMQENLQVFDFDLTDADMQRIDALDGSQPQLYQTQR